MKYYAFLVVTRIDTTVADKVGVYTYDTVDEAIAGFHGYMNTYMKDATVATVLCKVINGAGGEHRTEYWVRPTAEPEPEPTE